MRAIYTNPAGQIEDWRSNLAGVTQEGAGPYGTVPKVPSPTATQSTALGGNVAALPQIEQIMQRINQQAAQSMKGQLEMNLPGYSGAMGQAMGNIGQWQAGIVPSDVQTQIQQMAAERGIATGLPGSQNTNAAMLRALGLTSLGLQQQGLQGLESLMGAVPKVQPWDPSALFVTPAQQQEWQYLANMMAAAPSPAEAAAEELSAARSGVGYGGSLGGYGKSTWYDRPSGIYPASPLTTGWR